MIKLLIISLLSITVFTAIRSDLVHRVPVILSLFRDMLTIFKLMSMLVILIHLIHQGDYIMSLWRLPVMLTTQILSHYGLMVDQAVHLC